MNGLLSILLLDLKRFWINPWRIVFSLVQPLLYLFVLGAGLGGGTFAEAGYYQAYIFPGIVALTLMFTASSAAVSIVHDRQLGYFKALLVSPVPRSVICLGKILAGTLIAMAQGLLLLPFAPYVGVGFSPGILLQFVLCMGLCALMFSTLSLIIAMPFRSVMVFPVITNALLLPMFFLSGGLYALDLTPLWLNSLLKFNPAAYGVDLMRGALTGRYYFNSTLSVWVMLIVSLLNATLINICMSHTGE